MLGSKEDQVESGDRSIDVFRSSIESLVDSQNGEAKK